MDLASSSIMSIQEIRDEIESLKSQINCLDTEIKEAKDKGEKIEALGLLNKQNALIAERTQWVALALLGQDRCKLIILIFCLVGCIYYMFIVFLKVSKREWLFPLKR